MPKSREVLYFTSQPALLRLPHFRQIDQISRRTRVMHKTTYNSYLQSLAVRCAVLSPLRPLRDRSIFPVPLPRKLLHTCRLGQWFCTTVATYPLNHN